jgi:hypothetical protein
VAFYVMTFLEFLFLGDSKLAECLGAGFLSGVCVRVHVHVRVRVCVCARA